MTCTQLCKRVAAEMAIKAGRGDVASAADAITATNCVLLCVEGHAVRAVAIAVEIAKRRGLLGLEQSPREAS